MCQCIHNFKYLSTDSLFWSHSTLHFQPSTDSERMLAMLLVRLGDVLKNCFLSACWFRRAAPRVLSRRLSAQGRCTSADHVLGNAAT